MRSRNSFIRRTVFAALFCASGWMAHAAEPWTREANTSLKLPLNPPVFGYAVTNAFPGLSFSQPVAIVSPPGETNRLFVLEKAGNIVVITNLAAPTRTVFITVPVMPDGESGLLGLAFHPGHATNGFFYVFATRNFTTTQGRGRHQRLSRFQTAPGNPNQAFLGSEQPLITQFDEASNHNGGDLHFGPDGYLYVSVGDEGPQRDGANNSQTITKDFFSAILRIDVDERPGNLPPNPHPAIHGGYSVPADNPYVGATSFNGLPVDPNLVRTEFYAVGFRNPWRMSFDPVTGWLYVGDVGQDAWEEIDVVVKGGNYGWVFREGRHAGFRTPPPGFTSIDPIIEYAHGSGPTRGNSVTGGVVYRGQRLSQLHGAYIYGDYVSGNIWASFYNGTNATPPRHLTTDADIAAFGVDPRNGDILLADLVENRIKRLTYSGQATGQPLPPTLASTGAFVDLDALQPEPGIVPYDLNLPFWSDGAVKRRWFSVPDPSAKIIFNAEGNWSFPAGTIWIKHFDLELTNGVPESLRRLETRFLVKNSEGVYGVTYRWDESQTQATLVPDEGLNETFHIQSRDGSVREQIWRYPGRNECLACHTPQGGGALGFNTAQLHRAFGYASGEENQLAALARTGYLENPPDHLRGLRAHPRLDDEQVSLEARVRSYLAVNCSQCHQPGGSGRGLFDTRHATVTSSAGLIHGELVEKRGNLPFRVFLPGFPALSEALLRVQSLGANRMPPLATSVVDTNAVDLLHRWITTESRNFLRYEDWVFGNDIDPASSEAGRTADPDRDGASNYLEYLVGTSPVLSLNPWRVSVRRAGEVVQIRFAQAANRIFQVEVTSTLAADARWIPLDVPGNDPLPLATSRETVIEDPIDPNAPRFYRVRVAEH